MQAYTVGKLEAGAALQLLKNVPASVESALARLVKFLAVKVSTSTAPEDSQHEVCHA